MITSHTASKLNELNLSHDKCKTIKKINSNCIFYLIKDSYTFHLPNFMVIVIFLESTLRTSTFIFFFSRFLFSLVPLRSILNYSFSDVDESNILMDFRNHFMVPLEAEEKTSMQKETIY